MYRRSVRSLLYYITTLTLLQLVYINIYMQRSIEVLGFKTLNKQQYMWLDLLNHPYGNTNKVDSFLSIFNGWMNKLLTIQVYTIANGLAVCLNSWLVSKTCLDVHECSGSHSLNGCISVAKSGWKPAGNRNPTACWWHLPHFGICGAQNGLNWHHLTA